MRVAVTGGAGFIGRAVVERLAARGDHVVALVRDPARAGHLESDRTELVRSDLGDSPALRTAMTGAEAVVHVGELGFAPRGLADGVAATWGRRHDRPAA